METGNMCLCVRYHGNLAFPQVPVYCVCTAVILLLSETFLDFVLDCLRSVRFLKWDVQSLVELNIHRLDT